MNSEKLIEVLVTEDVTMISQEDIQKLISDFPYFDIARLLSLLVTQENSPSKVSKDIIDSAIYFRERKKLYHLLNSDLRKSLIKNYKTETSSSPEEDFLNLSSVNQNMKNDLLDFTYSERGLRNNNKNIKSDHSIEEKSKTASKAIPKDKKTLIEKFLIEEPGVIPANKKTDLKGDVSKTSVLESENLLSDTLAKIYVKQGLYNKSIFAYEKLSLKYPEKSAYFASQIKEIKEIINNK